MGTAYKIRVNNPEEKRLLKIQTRWDNNIKINQ